MYSAYPAVFTKESKITACATTLVRCVLSMDAFCERLKELDPRLLISRNSGTRWQRFLNHHTEEAIAYRSAANTWKPGYIKFEKERCNHTGLAGRYSVIQNLWMKRRNLKW
ncbi:hypothetical protein LWM68_31770 [Niabella sp. W65]|nr:hypothetical protein [Niabella sp. W65]MCH7366944.1 hypothetical protein [Niabella sp. W65]ULT42637.1 hypothetical protein KRR40_03310 [Niabella sp. I65]